MTERKYPGFWVRIASAWVDTLGFAFATLGSLLLLLPLGESLSTEAFLQLYLFVWFPGSLAATLSGLAFLNARGRQSPGKILFGLGVVDRQFRPVSFRRSLLRTLVHSLLLGSSFLLIPFTRGRRGLHDLIGGTFVTRTRPPLRWERLIALVVLAFTVWIDATVVGELDRYLQSFRAASNSMAPALLEGDNFITDTRRAGTLEPRRGDIVVYEHPKEAGRMVVKRIMACRENGYPCATPCSTSTGSLARGSGRLSRAWTCRDFGAWQSPAGPLLPPRGQQGQQFRQPHPWPGSARFPAR